MRLISERIETKMAPQRISTPMVQSGDSLRPLTDEDLGRSKMMPNVKGFHFSSGEVFKTMAKEMFEKTTTGISRGSFAKLKPIIDPEKKQDVNQYGDYFYNSNIWRDANDMLFNQGLEPEDVVSKIKEKYFKDANVQAQEKRLADVISAINKATEEYVKEKDNAKASSIMNSIKQNKKDLVGAALDAIVMYEVEDMPDKAGELKKTMEETGVDLESIKDNEYHDLLLLKNYVGGSGQSDEEVVEGEVQIFTGGEHNLLDLSTSIGPEFLEAVRKDASIQVEGLDVRTVGIDLYDTAVKSLGDTDKTQQWLKDLGMDGVISYVFKTERALKASMPKEVQGKKTMKVKHSAGGKAFTQTHDEEGEGGTLQVGDDFFDPGSMGGGPFSGIDDANLHRYWSQGDTKKSFIMSDPEANKQYMDMEWDDFNTRDKKRFMEFLIKSGAKLFDWKPAVVSKEWEQTRESIKDAMKAIDASDQSKEMKDRLKDVYIDKHFGDFPILADNFTMQELTMDWDKLTQAQKNMFAAYVAQKTDVMSESTSMLLEARGERYQYEEEDFESLWNKGRGEAVQDFINTYLVPPDHSLKKRIEQLESDDKLSDRSKMELEARRAELDANAKKRDSWSSGLTGKSWDSLDTRLKTRFKKFVTSKLLLNDMIVSRLYKKLDAEREEFFEKRFPNQDQSQYPEYDDLNKTMKLEFQNFIRSSKGKLKVGDVEGRGEERGEITGIEGEDDALTKEPVDITRKRQSFRHTEPVYVLFDEKSFANAEVISEAITPMILESLGLL